MLLDTFFLNLNTIVGHIILKSDTFFLIGHIFHLPDSRLMSPKAVLGHSRCELSETGSRCERLILPRSESLSLMSASTPKV